MKELWGHDELAASVQAYRDMQRTIDAGRAVNKTAVYRSLAERYGRTVKAFEYRMQNISAVLEGQGRPWIEGLKPAKNVGADVTRQLESIIAASDRIAAPDAELAETQAMRDWLIGIARNRSVVRYKDFMATFGIPSRTTLTQALTRIGELSRDADEPILTALVVGTATGRCSAGLREAFGIADDAKERARLYEYWSQRDIELATNEASTYPLDQRAARFAMVAVRPDQAKFRKDVFLACAGRCVITACDISLALDAAHRTGRDWRKGHNSAADGLLLRKDLHALYDAGLLTVDEQGFVRIADEMRSHYPSLAGMRVRIAGS